MNVHHPVICEGSGKRIIGPNAQIGKEAEVSVGKRGDSDHWSATFDWARGLY